MTTDFIKLKSNEQFLVSALQELRQPTQRWGLIDQFEEGDDPNGPKRFAGFQLWWNPENTDPDIPLEVVVAKAQEYKDAWLALEYQRLRAQEYPSMKDQLDMQYWDAINGTTVWADTINAIKAKYPKP